MTALSRQCGWVMPALAAMLMPAYCGIDDTRWLAAAAARFKMSFSRAAKFRRLASAPAGLFLAYIEASFTRDYLPCHLAFAAAALLAWLSAR